VSQAKYLEWLADPTGASDATSSVNTLLALGGTIDGGGGTYLVGNITASVAGTEIRNATFIDKASTTGALLTLNAADCALEDVTVTVTQSPSLVYGILVRGARYHLEHVRVSGTRWDALTPNTACSPTYGIRTEDAGGAPMAGGRMDDVAVDGCDTGFHCFNQEDFVFEDCVSSYCRDFGFNLGSGASSRRGRIVNPYGKCCGQYALTFAFQTVTYGTTYPYPYEDIEISGARAENCGWMSYLTGRNGSAVGSGKMGFDLTDLGNNRLRFQGTAVNCLQGGGEYKYGQVPSGFTLTPSGHKGARIEIDAYSNLDYGVGFYVVNGDNSPAATATAEAIIRGSAQYNVAPAFVVGNSYKQFDVVSANGYDWVCASNGIAGSTTPTGGHVVRLLTTNGSTSAGSAVLNFADTTNVTVGDVVFAGPNLPDGTAVVSKTATTVTVSANATGSGLANPSSVLFFKKVIDGTLSWLAFEATPSASANCIGLEIRSSAKITANWTSIGCSRGVYLSCLSSADNTIYGLSLSAVVRDAIWGILVVGSSGGLSNAVFRDCDVEATTPLYQLSSGTTNTITVTGGRWVADVSTGLAFRIDNGTNTIRFEGGAFFFGRSSAVYVHGGTNTIYADDVVLETPASSSVPVLMDAGSGTWAWGHSAGIRNGNPASHPGYNVTGGTMTVSGKVTRLDQSAAPTSGTTKGSVGEMIVLGTPTATEWAYLCTVGPATYTWKKLALT